MKPLALFQPRPAVRPAGQAPAAAWTPTTPERRDQLRSCLGAGVFVPSTYGVCRDATPFLESHCRFDETGGVVCREPGGAWMPLDGYLATYYGGPTQAVAPLPAPLAPSSPSAPAAPPAPAPVSDRDLELARLRVQVDQQAHMIRGLQISLGVALVGVPLVGWLVRRGRRRS